MVGHHSPRGRNLTAKSASDSAANYVRFSADPGRGFLCESFASPVVQALYVLTFGLDKKADFPFFPGGSS
jgi:hypothetical protein